MKRNLLIILILVIFSLPSIVSFFNKGFFQSDDGEWIIIRFSAFHQALRDGQLPVRFLGRLNYGYGYPVSNFLYPGFMYLAEIPKFLGFGFVNSIKIVLGLSMIGSAIFCFLWLSRFFDKLASFIGAIFYLYTPYHLFDLYKRGSVGEILALSIITFIFWQTERRSFFWSSIGIAALIMSHNTLAVLFLGLVILYMGLDIYVSKDKISILRKDLLAFMFGLGISSFFWMPAFFELKYTIFSQTQVSDWQKYFVNPTLIGISTFFVFLLTIIFFFAGRIKLAKHRLTLLLLVVGILSVFFASSISSPLWNILPVSFIQFPFRFLSLTVVCVAFLSSVVVSKLRGNQKIIAVTLFFLLLGFSAAPYIKPSEFFDKGDLYYATNEATTTVQNEYMPKWVKKLPVKRFENKIELIEGKGEVKNLKYNSKSITFGMSSSTNSKLRINTIYYPGWTTKIDGRKILISYNNDKGTMEIDVAKGENKVELNFSETPIRLMSDFISLTSLVILLFIGRIQSVKKILRVWF